MNKYEIRKMTPSDVDLLQQISIETFTDTFGKDNSPEHLADYLTQAYALEKLTEELKDKETDFFLVSIDQEPAGYLKSNTANMFFIWEMIPKQTIYSSSNYSNQEV